MSKAKVDPQRCKGCLLCVVNCPKKAIVSLDVINAKGYQVVAVEEEKCIGCGICYKVCPDYVFTISTVD